MSAKRHKNIETSDNIDKGDLTFDDVLIEYATLRPETMGLPYAVYISTKEGRQHDVQVKFSRSPDFPIEQTAIVGLRPEIQWLSGMPLMSEDFDLAMLWIELNYDTIVAYWDREIIYTGDLLAALKAIE